jgi:type IX secretion system PorP/SprF family membrane protein
VVAHHFKLSKEWIINTGLLGGGLTNKLNFSKLITAQPNNPNFPESNTSSIYPDLGLGLWLDKSNKFNFGLAIIHIMTIVMKYQNVVQKVASHYNLLANYDKRFSKKYSLKPYINVRTDGSVAQFDLGLINKFWNLGILGFTYRLNDSFAILAGVDHKWFRILYSYDFNTSKLKAYNSGSHEFMLSAKIHYKTK